MSPGISRRLIESTGGKGSTATWSQVVESYEAIPEKFKTACAVLRDQTGAFPYVVFAPPLVETRRQASAKVIAVLDEAFFIWEVAGSRIVATVYRLDDVTDIEVGEILLYSWLTITGTNAEGTFTSTRIPYNTASAACYQPFIEHFRPEPRDTEESEWAQEKAKFYFLTTDHFKFMNYGEASLIRGERIHEIIWQPKIRRPLITLFGRSLHRTLAVAHLAILTDSEVIFIGDDKRQSDLKSGQYGGIWQYVPLRHISSAVVSPRLQDTLHLSVYLDAGGRRFDKMYEALNQSRVEEFCRALQRTRRATEGAGEI